MIAAPHKWSLKVIIARKNVSTAMAASSALPMKSSRDRCNSSLIVERSRGEACAAGEQATTARKAVLRCSDARQCSDTCCTDSMLIWLLASWAYMVYGVMARLVPR